MPGYVLVTSSPTRDLSVQPDGSYGTRTGDRSNASLLVKYGPVRGRRITNWREWK